MSQKCICEICGQERDDSVGWFLVRAENNRDRVSVLHWDVQRARDKSMHPVCGAEHARELVARWVFSGTLCCGAQGARWRVDVPLASLKTPPRATDPLDLDLQALVKADPETLIAMLDAVEGALQEKWSQVEHDDQEVLVYDA